MKQEGKKEEVVWQGETKQRDRSMVDNFSMAVRMSEPQMQQMRAASNQTDSFVHFTLDMQTAVACISAVQLA